MNYFTNNNNEIFAYDNEQISQGYGQDLTELESPIWNGSILIGHKNINQVETKEDGSYATYYNEDGTIDWELETKEQIEKARGDIETEIVKELDRIAKQYRYDDIKSARASAGVPLDGTETDEEVAIYNEALSLAKWDRVVWAESSRLEQQVLDGTVALPRAHP